MHTCILKPSEDSELMGLKVDIAKRTISQWTYIPILLYGELCTYTDPPSLPSLTPMSLHHGDNTHIWIKNLPTSQSYDKPSAEPIVRHRWYVSLSSETTFLHPMFFAVKDVCLVWSMIVALTADQGARITQTTSCSCRHRRSKILWAFWRGRKDQK